MSERMNTRFALYYLPAAGSPLARFGAVWLGRDAARPPGWLAGIDAAGWRRMVAVPALYGLHGTLKAPFRLAPGRDRAGLEKAVRRLAAAWPAFQEPPLRLANMGGFLALVPARPAPAMAQLAAAAVAGLDGFRAPPLPEELARRRVGLDARQETLLARWGYPYVMDAFRFHLTLTCRLGDGAREQVAAVLAPQVAPFCRRPWAMTEIALVRQAAPGAPFQAVGRYRLAARGRRVRAIEAVLRDAGFRA